MYFFVGYILFCNDIEICIARLLVHFLHLSNAVCRRKTAGDELLCDEPANNYVIIIYLYYNSPYFCLSLCLSVVLIWGLYRPSSEPIALRNVLKRSTRHTLHIIRFWHFSSAVIITKNAKNCVCAFNPVGAATSNKTHRERRMRKVL